MDQRAFQLFTRGHFVKGKQCHLVSVRSNKILIHFVLVYSVLFYCFKIWAKPGLFFCFFASFSQCKDKYITIETINEKSIFGVHGIGTLGGRMVDKDKSNELWWHPLHHSYVLNHASKSSSNW